MRSTRTVTLALLTIWLVVAGAGVTKMHAQATASQPGAAAGQEPTDQFVPLKALPSQEQLPAATLVMTAYAFVWAVLLVYVWTVWRRLMKVEREMQELSSRLGQKR
jgi:CcmD family protein